MGNSPGKQALEEFAKTIRVGDVAGVDNFLRRIAAARGQEGNPSDKLVQELRTLDLNKPLPEGLTPLQLAASCGRVEVVRHLLDTCRANPQLQDLDPNAEDSRRRTALHFAAQFTSPPNCAQCVADLLSRQADPCIADCDGRTPLDVARSVRCSHCVRTIEDNVKVWQGWADHDEHVLLQLPNWRARWLVVCKDRYPNTGPWREASSVSVSCFNCHTVLKAPAYAYRLRCSCCSAEVSVTSSLQLALYDASWPQTSALPSTPVPSVKIQLPMAPGQIMAKALEDAGLRSFAGALFEGKLRRALQSTGGGTARSHGFTVKILRPVGGALACEHSFRVATSPERDRLVDILRDPARAAYEAAISPAQSAAPPQALSAGGPQATTTGGRAPPPAAPWSCPQCTYTHSGAEALLTRCAMCGHERGVPMPAVSGAGDGLAQLPEPSAPPLSEDACNAAHVQAVAAAPGAAAAAQAVSAAPLPPVSSCAAGIEATAPPPPPPPLPQAVASAAAVSAPAAPPAPAKAGAEGAQDDEVDMCVICLERKADTAVVPCGHMCGCFQCLQSLHGAQGAQCPMCRGPVTSTIRIYRA